MPSQADITRPTAPYGALAYFLDLHPASDNFLADVIEGLSKPQKSISPLYFYDATGSQIFNKITELEEYYPTRTEKLLFDHHAKDITKAINPQSVIFEYGSGSSEKTEWLINGLNQPIAYIAMDISKEHLLKSANDLAATLDIPVAAICADFHAPVRLPTDILPPHNTTLGYFPGSTIGNMTPEEAVTFLTRAADTLGDGAQLLIGIDLEKDINILQAAYDDKAGVTAAFNINLLHRMRRDLKAEIEIDAFKHKAIYNADAYRIEMHLEAIRPTTIHLGDRSFSFAKGETLHTENSHKYSINRFKTLVEKTSWQLTNYWKDPKGWYGACLLGNS